MIIAAYLDEIEATSRDILANPQIHSIIDDSEIVDRVLKYCKGIRTAADAGDVSAAAMVGISLGEILQAFRKIEDVIRRDESYVSPLDRAHAAAVERRKVFAIWRDRGFAPTVAYEKAAEQLGVSTKTIVRAVNGH
jgi:hypothetical protein